MLSVIVELAAAVRSCTELELPGRPDQTHVVREFVTGLLWSRPGIDEDLLVIGALVANAVRRRGSGRGDRSSWTSATPRGVRPSRSPTKAVWPSGGGRLCNARGKRRPLTDDWGL